MSNSINTTVTQNAMNQLQTKSGFKGAVIIPGTEKAKSPVTSRGMGLDPLATAKNMNPINLAGLDSLSVARGMQPINREIAPGRFENIDFSNTIFLSNNLHGGPALQNETDSYTIVNHNGKDFYLYNSENAKYLNDPNLKVSDNGYMSIQVEPKNGGVFAFLILGRAVDATEYVPPKYTADFFDASSDFITKAAQEYAKTGAEEILSKPQYSSDQFISSVLDFFSKGNFTQTEMEITKSSIESIIKELAEMLRNGEEVDLNKIKGKVDIMGEQVSITQLLEMQNYGKELSTKLVGENGELRRFGNDNISDFAGRGLIKSMGMAYGDQIGGTVGEMFKSAWGAEVDRHAEVIKNMGDYAISGEAQTWHSNALKNGAQYVYDVFSKIDTSSKENALKSFNVLSVEIDAAISKFLNQYNSAPSSMAAKLRSEVDSFFYDLMGFKSVDMMA